MSRGRQYLTYLIAKAQTLAHARASGPVATNGGGGTWFGVEDEVDEEVGRSAEPILRQWDEREAGGDDSYAVRGRYVACEMMKEGGMLAPGTRGMSRMHEWFEQQARNAKELDGLREAIWVQRLRAHSSKPTT